MGKQKKNQSKKKSNSKSSKKKQPEITIRQQERITSNEVILLLPALFLVTVYMFCVRGRIIPSNTGEFYWSTSGEYVGDLYAYFRMQVFVILTIAAIICLLIYFYNDYIDIKKHAVYIPMGVYAAAVLLSYVFSDYKDIALLGATGIYEGTIALICYMCILFYTMHAVRNERCVKLVVNCFCIACLVLGIWGILQVNGIRLANLPAWLYIPATMMDSAQAAAQGVVTAVTWFFGNQNYASFFMIFPICIFAMLCISRKDTKWQVAYAALTGLMMYNLWQTASIGGMVGLAAAFVAAVLIAGAKNIWKWKKSLGLLILFGVLSIILSSSIISTQVKGSLPAESTPAAKVEVAPVQEPENVPAEDAANAPAAPAEQTETASAEQQEAPPEAQTPVAPQNVRIDYIKTEGSDVIFSFQGEEYTIAVENDEIKSVTDSSGNNVPYSNALFTASVTADETAGRNLINIATARKNWRFVTMDDGDVYYIPPSGQAVKLDETEKMGFEGNERFGSGRGYIWSRTLPMLKDTIILGKGADTYMACFPHDDYAGRYNMYMVTESSEVLVDKPHNMYMGVAFNTGMLSLLAQLAIYGIYLIESVRAYRRHQYRGFKDYMGMAVFIAITGFLFAGLVYDTTVQIMPMVYVFLGMGFAVNRMIFAEKAVSAESEKVLGD